MFLCFVMILFSMIGVQFFEGQLQGLCVLNVGPDISQPMVPEQRCSASIQCPTHAWCDTSQENPLAGLIGFDMLPQALLTMFIVSTVDNWSPIMIGLQSQQAWLFFIVFHICVTFVAISLLIAVIGNALMGNHARDDPDHAIKLLSAKSVDNDDATINSNIKLRCQGCLSLCLESLILCRYCQVTGIQAFHTLYCDFQCCDPLYLFHRYASSTT